MEFIKHSTLEIVYVLLAAFGGMARYLQQYYLDERKFAWRHMFVHMIISAFSGYMFYQFGITMLNLPSEMMPIIAGMGGWMGVSALKFLEDALLKRLKDKK